MLRVRFDFFRVFYSLREEVRFIGIYLMYIYWSFFLVGFWGVEVCEIFFVFRERGNFLVGGIGRLRINK